MRNDAVAMVAAMLARIEVIILRFDAQSAVGTRNTKVRNAHGSREAVIRVIESRSASARCIWARFAYHTVKTRTPPAPEEAERLQRCI